MKMNIFLLIITVSLLVLKTQGTDSDNLLTNILTRISMDFLGELGDAENVDTLKTFFSDVDTQMVLRTLKEIGLGFGGGLGKMVYGEDQGKARSLGGGFELKFGGCPIDQDTAIDNEDSPLYKTVKSLFDGKNGINIYPAYFNSIFRRFGSGTASVHDPETAEPIPCHGERIGSARQYFEGFVEGEEAKIGHGYANGCVEAEGSGEASVKIIDGDAVNHLSIKGIGLAYGIGNVEDLAKQ